MEAKVNIKQVNLETALSIINTREPKGLFYVVEKDKDNHDIFVGIDNTTGDAWVEQFLAEIVCLNWLEGKFEIDDISDTSHQNTTKQ